MNDMQGIEQAVEAFNNLSQEDKTALAELNDKIQAHSGKWGVQEGGEKNTDGSIQMLWTQSDPFAWEFINFMQDKNLLPFFEWMDWKEGSELFSSKDKNKYENVDLETALKLVYAVTRKERFADGTIAWAFKDGGFTSLVNRLIVLSELQ